MDSVNKCTVGIIAELLRVFPAGGNDERNPPTSQKFASPCPPAPPPLPAARKIPSTVDSPHQTFIPPTKSQPPPTKQQFSSCKPIKTAFLALVIAPAPLLF